MKLQWEGITNTSLQGFLEEVYVLFAWFPPALFITSPTI